MVETPSSRSILLFRKDLRLFDNAALLAACQRGDVLPIYIHQTHESSLNKVLYSSSIGGASKWWLHHSLASLKKSLQQNNQNLYFFQAKSDTEVFKLLKQLCIENQCNQVFWNRRYEPHHIQSDKDLKSSLQQQGINAHSFNNNLLSEPWTQMNKQGSPFKVFTPYWRHCKNKFFSETSVPLPLEKPIFHHPDYLWSTPNDCQLADLNLLPSNPDWADQFHQFWKPGESNAQKNWDNFLSNIIDDYEENRNIPSIDGTSKLSPYLTFGEISVRQIWHDAYQLKTLNNNKSLDRFLNEIGWREFSYYQLFHFPDLPNHNFNPKFNHFAWEDNKKHLIAWQKGMTGYPLVDAGLRELWNTGYMHNRVRMVVASFLCKDLLINWQKGASWFWDTLLDADLASNSASWQWCAGCGADAAPFFRIFNPVTQSEKFDPDTSYILSLIHI